jgi:hypothetical protein
VQFDEAIDAKFERIPAEKNPEPDGDRNLLLPRGSTYSYSA